MEGRSEILASLRKTLAKAERIGGEVSIPLGLDAADKTLRGGLRAGSLHEVYAFDGSHGAAATGFATALALRLAEGKNIFWISTDFAAVEQGSLNATGLLELGLDPARLCFVRLNRGDDALRAAGDILACSSVGALILEIQGKLKSLDLTASRRLCLAASERNVATILLRLGAQPEASAAETRWLVQSAASPPLRDEEDWGHPRFDVRLLRNRHGELGSWRMVWDIDDGFFRKHIQEQPSHHGGVVSAPADGPSAAPDAARRAG